MWLKAKSVNVEVIVCLTMVHDFLTNCADREKTFRVSSKLRFLISVTMTFFTQIKKLLKYI